MTKSPDTTFTLTAENAETLRQYATLVGLTPEDFLNAFLAEFLVNRFGDPETGNAEPFLGSFTLNHQATALRADTTPGRPAAVVQALIGHDSEAIHQHYLSVGFDALKKAANALPDVT